MRLGAVVLTMGNRPEELRALLDSVAKQHGDPIEVVVVGNGSPLPELPEGVRTVELPENVGIPAGRNVGIEAFGPGGSEVDVLLFLDDDGLLAKEDTAELCREAFAADPELGIISFRIADPDTGETQRRHVPRLRASDPMRSSRVTTFLGGANAVRTQVFEEVGGLPDDFFYAHEETDLAWRALDAGWHDRLPVGHGPLPPDDGTRPGMRSTTGWWPVTVCGWPAATSPPCWSRSISVSGSCSPSPVGRRDRRCGPGWAASRRAGPPRAVPGAP